MKKRGAKKIKSNMDVAHLFEYIKRYRFFALILIPLYTFLFAIQDSLLLSNLSRIGNMPNNYGKFVVWGIVCSSFYNSFFAFLFSMLGYPHKGGWTLYRIACLLLLLTVLLPFIPEKYPFFSFLHNQFAMIATLVTLAATFLLTLHTKSIDPKIYQKALLMWIVDVALCFVVLLRTGISGLTETLFIITTSVHLYCIMWWTYCSGKLENSL